MSWEKACTSISWGETKVLHYMLQGEGIRGFLAHSFGDPSYSYLFVLLVWSVSNGFISFEMLGT